MCEGTGCTKPATNDVSIRVLEPLAFVYRKYCDDCTAKADRRAMSEVVSVSAVRSTDAKVDDA